MLTPQAQTDPPLSLSVSVLKEILEHAKPLGHHEEPDSYVRELVRHAGVKRWLKVVAARQDDFEVIDFPFASGMALVRVMRSGAWERIT